MTQSKRWPALLIVLQSLIYAFGDVIAKRIYPGHSLSLMLTIRYLMASGALAIMMGRRGLELLRRTPLRVWLPPGIFMALSCISAQFALAHTAVTNMAFLRSLTALLTPLLALLIFRRKYRLWHVWLQLLVLAGLYLLCAKGGLSAFGLGDAVALFSALMNASSLVFSERASHSMDAAVLAVGQAFCCFVFCFCWFLASGDQPDALTLPAWIGLAYLAFGCTAAGFILQNAALRRLPSRSIAMVQCSYPVITSALSFFFLGELLAPAGIAGAAIILVCVFLESFLQDKPVQKMSAR
ncbi:MAG: DMT family transporter [Oscillibacter sp.]|nr:DMT family transporter [Oscillibacter sp.]